MVEGQGQLCKVEFHIFLCKHNLIRTGQIYSLNSEEEGNSAGKITTTKKKRHSFDIRLQLPKKQEKNRELMLSQYQHFK